MHDGTFCRFRGKKKLLFHEVFCEISISTSGERFCRCGPINLRGISYVSYSYVFFGLVGALSSLTGTQEYEDRAKLD